MELLQYNVALKTLSIATFFSRGNSQDWLSHQPIIISTKLGLSPVIRQGPRGSAFLLVGTVYFWTHPPGFPADATEWHIKRYNLWWKIAGEMFLIEKGISHVYLLWLNLTLAQPWICWLLRVVSGWWISSHQWLWWESMSVAVISTLGFIFIGQDLNGSFRKVLQEQIRFRGRSLPWEAVGLPEDSWLWSGLPGSGPSSVAQSLASVYPLRSRTFISHHWRGIKVEKVRLIEMTLEQQRFGAPTPCALKNPWIPFNSLQNFTINILLLILSLPSNVNSWLTQLYVFYVLYTVFFQ